MSFGRILLGGGHASAGPVITTPHSRLGEIGFNHVHGLILTIVMIVFGSIALALTIYNHRSAITGRR